MSSRQERFNQKKKKMDQALHGSEIEFDEPVEPKKNKQQEAMDDALLDLKIAGKELCQIAQESAEKERESGNKIKDFISGRSDFELVLWNWVMEDKWMIKTYLALALCVPVGLIWWIEENKACGIFMTIFIGLISWIFVALLSPFISAFIKALANCNIVWFTVRLKSYNPIASSVIGLLNLVHRLIAQGSVLLSIAFGLFAPLFFNGADSWKNYLIIFCIMTPMALVSMFLISYLWKCVYYLIATITLSISGVGNKYRLVYLWNSNKVFKKSF
jgi:hypothetical protein